MPGLQNFHLPLSDSIYRRLRQEAERSGVPATSLAREALEAWLDKLHRQALHAEIAQYARRHAGTGADLDEQLEATGVEFLNGTKPRLKRTPKKAKR